MDSMGSDPSRMPPVLTHPNPYPYPKCPLAARKPVTSGPQAAPRDRTMFVMPIVAVLSSGDTTPLTYD